MTTTTAYRNLIAAIVTDPRRVARLDDIHARSGGVDAAALSRRSELMTPATDEATLRPRSAPFTP